MVHREHPNCPKCGNKLTPINKDMGKDFVGDTFTGLYQHCSCLSSLPTSTEGKDEYLVIPIKDIQEVMTIVAGEIKRYTDMGNEPKHHVLRIANEKHFAFLTDLLKNNKRQSLRQSQPGSAEGEDEMWDEFINEARKLIWWEDAELPQDVEAQKKVLKSKYTLQTKNK